GFLDGHRQHLRDAVAGVAHGERLLGEAAAAARVAADVDVGQEAHLHAQPPLPGARLAAAARYVEREAPGAPATQPRFRQLCEEAPNVVVEADVRGGCRARRAADRGLVDLDGASEVLDAVDPAVRTDPASRQAERTTDAAVEHVTHQPRLPAAPHSGHTGPRAQRGPDGDVLPG